MIAPNATGTATVTAPSAGASVSRRKSPTTLRLRATWGYGRTKVGLGLFGVVLAVALLGPLFAPYSPSEFVGAAFAGPSRAALLGTDNLGRDVLSRVLWGGLTVFGLSIAATVLGVTVGAALGMAAGYAKRWLDEVIMRLLDVLLAFPMIVIVLLAVSVVGPKLWLIVVACGFAHAPRVARVARGATLQVIDRDFVKAAEMMNVPRWRILAGEVLPNITSPLMVELGLRFAYSIATIAALSFLGFGLQPPAADWGLMINENRIALSTQPWAVVVPVLLIGIATVGANLVVDGFSRAMIGIERVAGG